MVQSKFNSIIHGITSLKIQGAQHVAFASLDALQEAVKASKAQSINELRKHLLQAHKILLYTRPTEPALRNALYVSLQPVLQAQDNLPLADVKKKTINTIHSAQEHLTLSPKAIAKITSKKIRKNIVIYTHCHSSTVTTTLIEAWKKGKRFVVHNTETRPKYQGRRTAIELALEHIPVEHYIDSAMPYAIQSADLVLLGVDAITAEGFVVNKVGTSMVCSLAKQYSVPVYFCTDSWKFDPLTRGGKDEVIERRDPDEVWGGAPKGVHINNVAFDLVPPSIFAGVISELGILPIKVFLTEVIHKNPWMEKLKIPTTASCRV